MVRAVWVCLLLLPACGTGLRDGTYPGQPRFTLHGTIENIVVNPNYATDILRVTVLWEMVAQPVASATAAPEASGASEPTASAPPSATPSTPTPPSQPTVSGQQGGAVSVAFPAPVTLVLYDEPQLGSNDVAWQAEGTVIIYYDVNGNGRYDPPTETIAATLSDYRLAFSADSSAADTVFVNSILDNPQSLALPFALVQRQCLENVEYLQAVANQAVSLEPALPSTCAAQ